jgi:hypothetical protein
VIAIGVVVLAAIVVALRARRGRGTGRNDTTDAMAVLLDRDAVYRGRRWKESDRPWL